MEPPAATVASEITSDRDHALPFLIRGTVCHVTGDPFARVSDTEVLEWFADGGLLVDKSGRITAVGRYEDVKGIDASAKIIDRRGCFILPGMIDLHIHFPQALMIGAFGEQLLDWLTKYTFPEEARYADEDYARAGARLFFDEMLSHGTTCALIFGAYFENATAAAFEEASRRGFRAIMGLLLSDRHVPQQFVRSPEQAYDCCKQLIANWHKKGNLRYAVTPRFAPTCSKELLEVCGRLLDEYPDVYLQTHLNENPDEVKWVKELFPQADSYLGIYQDCGLLGPRSVFAHCIHSTDSEIDRLASTQSRVAHCPSSNAFMGSGILPLRKFIDRGIVVGLGTDVGGGTGYGLFQEMSQAYKLQMLKMFSLGEPNCAVKLSGVKLMYMATLAGAKALGMERETGNLDEGKYADLVVVDPGLDKYLAARLANTNSMAEALFALATLATKHVIREVYIQGQLAHARITGA